ncbi:MAG: MotA/TolQ/ExbB proton channel family protein [Gammaproteobacteria bacterium]|nr:MotA/TolQ/ExbB proton channel family protein [Gammaproteobacteria bacterium]
MEIFNGIIKFFQDGGQFMYPILFIFASGVAIVIERFIFLSAERIRNRKEWERIVPHLYKGSFGDALLQAKKSRSAIANILIYGLERVQHKQSREEVEMAMEEGMMEILPRLERRTHYLSTLANVATLLGLLGTIIGLIQAFTVVSQADPAQKADLLSASISVAMNTTAFGLMAAILLLICHSVLQTKTTEVVDSLEMASVKCLNLISVPRGDFEEDIAA